jgi:hypothetical protein
MKVDTQPFPSVNMVEGCNRSARRQLDFAFGINMAGPAPRRYARKEKADPCDRPQKGEKEYITEEWRPKPTRADAKTSADVHMVFVLPAEFYAQSREELLVAQLYLGPRPVIFEKPRLKNYKHLKALYLKGYINGQLVNKMLVDTGATVNIMPYLVLHRLGHSTILSAAPVGAFY